MKIYILHVLYEPTIEGVFYTQEAAKQHEEILINKGAYPDGYLFIEEYEVTE